jgi:hypothetical protein
MTDFTATAPANKMTGSEFLDIIGPLFGKPTQAERELAEQKLKLRDEHNRAIQDAFKVKEPLADNIERRRRITAEYREKVRGASLRDRAGHERSQQSALPSPPPGDHPLRKDAA